MKEFTISCKQCGKPFTLRLVPKVAQLFEDTGRSTGSELTGTCPPCKATNPDPFTRMLMNAGITTITDEVKEDA